MSGIVSQDHSLKVSWHSLGFEGRNYVDIRLDSISWF